MVGIVYIGKKYRSMVVIILTPAEIYNNTFILYIKVVVVVGGG